MVNSVIKMAEVSQTDLRVLTELLRQKISDSTSNLLSEEVLRLLDHEINMDDFIEMTKILNEDVQLIRRLMATFDPQDLTDTDIKFMRRIDELLPKLDQMTQKLNTIQI